LQISLAGFCNFAFDGFNATGFNTGAGIAGENINYMSNAKHVQAMQGDLKDIQNGLRPLLAKAQQADEYELATLKAELRPWETRLKVLGNEVRGILTEHKAGLRRLGLA
jgi:hypothetical protein